MVALQGVIGRVKNSKDGLINIFSDSRSLERVTIVQTNSPGAPPSPRLQQTMTGFYCRIKSDRAASLEEWQEQYVEGSTGEDTKWFFPWWNKRTGFKLKDSPYCTRDPSKEQNISHALEECYMFMRERADLEINSRVIGNPGK
ncbi:hypothetical protein EVAR_59403_1 [Eumeta japonica]|uniref:Uncharacterized protein n=1 Tax=Eumeta variegata TaxID=151549 RepID=A0A4C1YL08_EUMVA|nr:hypothetical protein EVAR_59403_1 [Eumeta japonica]